MFVLQKCDDVQESDVSGPTAHHLIEALNSHYNGKISVVEKDEISLSGTVFLKILPMVQQ